MLQEKRTGGLPTIDLLSAADLVVECGSAIAIAAAYRGIPVVTLPVEVLMAQIEKTSGSRALEAVETGISESVAVDVASLAEAMASLLTKEGFAPMRARQLAAYPMPAERGVAARAIAGFLESLLKTSTLAEVPKSFAEDGFVAVFFFFVRDIDVRFLF